MAELPASLLEREVVGGALHPEAASEGSRRLSGFLSRLRTARPLIVFICSLVSGIVVSAVIILVSLQQSRSALAQVFAHPGHSLATIGDTLGVAYGALLSGALGKPAAFSLAMTHSSLANWAQAFQPLGATVTASVPLAVGGMGLAVAYRSGVFNIAAPAQMICGGIAASWVGFSFGSLPMPIHVALGLLAACVGGAVGGLAPGLLKVMTGANEVIVTIMLNYTMAGVLTWLVSDTFFSQLAGTSPVGRATSASGSLPELFGNVVGIDAGVVVAIFALLFGWVLLNRSRLGFELELVGTSPDAARLAGVRHGRAFLAAFGISGAVVGLAGAIPVLGNQHQLQATFGASVGILAITVAFVGRNRPVGVMFAALLYGVLQIGGLNLQGATGLSAELSTVVEAVIVLFMVAPALVAEIYRLKPVGGMRLGSLALSRGWGS